MPNSTQEQSEKTKIENQEDTKRKIKRKRNKNRKKSGIKVENLVSKTFQAKLETHAQNIIEENSSPNSTTIGVSGDAHHGQHKNTLEEIANHQTESCADQISFKHYTAVETESESCNQSVKMVLSEASKVNEKSRAEVLAEREAKKQAKQQAKCKNKAACNKSQIDVQPKSASVSQNQCLGEEVTNNWIRKSNTKELPKSAIPNASPGDDLEKRNKKNDLTKAERRAIQEAQRAAKAEAALKKPKEENKVPKELNQGRTEKNLIKPIKDCKVKLFNHLENCREDSNLFVNNLHIHPIIVRLGEQYSKRTIVGSNARCISFLNALKTVIRDYETPPKKEFARSLEIVIKNSVDHLHKCRPLAVAVCNAYKHIKHVLTQLPVDQPETELKERLCHFIDTYIENQIEKAAQAISSSVQDKISNGDVILTFGCSSLINYIFEEAHRRHVDFRVIVVDSRPFSEGQELLRRLTVKEIPCTYVLINAVGFVMPEVTKILLGAHALLSNGYVMARTGTAQVALVARSFNVPVLVCCETHKFSERFQTDAIVYNELGNPNDLVLDDKCRLMNWKSQNKLSLLNLNYDITPPELVTAVVTEVAILPCTSVPVILRIKPTEIGY